MPTDGPDNPAAQPQAAPTVTTAAAAKPHAVARPPGWFGETRWQWRWALLLVIATVVAYQPAWQGKPIWDDDLHLTPPQLTALDGLFRIWLQSGARHQYYPVVHSVFWLEHRLWGYAPLGYHLVNLLLHASSALLVARILLRLRVPGALLAAGIFALHPVEVESVAWISELKNTLSGFFYLAAAWSYFRFEHERDRNPNDRPRPSPPTPPTGKGRPNVSAPTPATGWPGGGLDSPATRWYVLSLALFVLGLLSKSVIATLPAGLLLIGWWRRGALRWKRDVQPLAPFFVVGAVMGLTTAWLEYHRIGAHGPDFALTLVERCLIAGRVLWFYAAKLCWPANLVFIYPRWHVSSAVWWQYLYPLAALALVLLLWRLARRARGPLAALLFFAGTLFPALGFLNVYPFRFSFVADHFQYLASLGVIVLASAGAARLLERWRLWGRPEGDALCAALLAVLGILTWRQSAMYTDMETLWATTLAKNPNSCMVQNNYGVVLLGKGRIDDANARFKRAVELEPRDPDGYVNLGYVLLRKGQYAQAIPCFERALSFQPYLASAHSNLGLLLLRQGQPGPAAEHFRKALLTEPYNAMVLNNLAWVLATSPDARVRNGAEAVRLAEQACRLAGPREPTYLATLAVAYAEAGNFDRAATTIQQAGQIAATLGWTDFVQKSRPMAQSFAARQPYRE